MRSLVTFAAVVIAGTLLVGCAAKKQAPVEATRAPEPLVADTCFNEGSVAALVFDPPIARDELPLDLSRETRQAGAFVGYEQLSTTFFYLRTDDQWRTDNSGLGRYERRAISERVGMSFR